ncbi:MAG: GNAT family N-acetyltransferase [Methanobacteriota archaeon]|nr:MAG: GNAT family N-acetyltransferase [Euryarchaeota archaeon]
MKSEDVPFAVDITDEEGWGYMEEDFQRLIDLEPSGCFVASDDDVEVGMLTTTSYGGIGWIGNVVTKSDRRQERIGSEMVKHAVRYLKDKSVGVIGLYSYLNAVAFYERIGFQESFRVARFSTIAKVSENRGARVVNQEALPRVVGFDQKYFPGDRIRLLGRMLKDFPELFFSIEEDGDIVGYVLGFCSPKACEIGPWMCDPDRPDTAENLLIDCLTTLEDTVSAIAVSVDNESAIQIVKRQGFEEEFQVSAMFFETGDHGMNLKGIFGIGALEKG